MNDPVIEEKRQENIAYIEEHRANVWKAFQNIIQIPQIREDIEKLGIMEELSKRCLNHDESKYSKEEFEPSRKWYYPTCDEEKSSARDEYGKAWEHHYTVNDHHWNHWVKDDGEAEPMSAPALYELICDWTGMGYKFGNDGYEYYHSNKESMTIHPDTRTKLESILSIIHYFNKA